MSRGAKITLVIFVIVFAIFGLIGASWFVFKQNRAQAAESYIYQGDSYLAREEYAQALISYKKAGLLTPRSFAPYYKQAILAKNTGHYNEAIEFLGKAIKLGPNEIANYLALGETNLLNNNLSAAKSAFLQAQKLAANSDDIDFRLVQVSLQEGNIDEAEKYLAEAEKDNPLPKYKIYQALLTSFNDPSSSLEMMADINGSVELGGFSLADFSNLFQKLKDTENMTSREVIIYQAFGQLGEVEFAVNGLEKISKDNPEMRDVWVFLGYGYLLSNDLEKAKSAIDKAINIDPVYPASYYLLSKYYEQNKDNFQANKMIAKAKMLGFDEENPLIVKSK